MKMNVRMMTRPPLARTSIAAACAMSLTLVAMPAAASSGGGPIEDPVPGPIPRGDIRVKLSRVADGLTAPNWGTFPQPDQGVVDERLFVTDQDGILWVIDTAAQTKSVFLDVSDLIVELGIGGPGTFDERGLLGVAFHPDYYDNGLLYTYTSQPDSAEPDFSTMPPDVDPNHQTIITEWQVPDPQNPDSVVDPNSAREILRIDEPQFNHNAGALNFSPDDDLLYIALGDGGRGDDQGTGHGDFGNGRDPSNPLGALLRIDPLGDNSANGQYGIPDDNPFVGQQGFVEEIFAYGFRNPFRFSFDQDDATLYLADVGQNAIEEIDIVTAGGNYGWNWKEGTFFFDPNGDGPGFVTNVDNGAPDDLIDPIAQYDHDEGIAVVGGFVHRGDNDSPLFARYIFGDFAQTFDNDGRLFYLDETNIITEFSLFGSAVFGRSLLGFGQDVNGEVFALVNSTGTPFEETGEVLKLVSLERAPIVDGFLIFGRSVGNDFRALQEDDDAAFRVESGFGNNLFEVHKVEFRAGAQSPIDSPGFLDVAVRSSVDQPAGVQRVMLRNWDSGGLDTIAIGAVGMDENLLLAEDIPAENYVRDDGRIEVQVRIVVQAPMIAFHFVSSTDLIEVGVR